MRRAVELERPAGELEAEGRRLGVHAVRPPDADVVAVPLRPLDDRVLGPLEPRQQELAGRADLKRESSVDDVGRGQSVMNPASVRPDLGRDGVHERGQVVLRLALELGDALGARRLRALSDLRHDVRGNGSELGPGLEGGELDVQPARELALLRPDPGHLGSGVARDHRLESRARAGGPPGESVTPSAHSRHTPARISQASSRSPGGWGLGMGPATRRGPSRPAAGIGSAVEDAGREGGGVLRVVHADRGDGHAGRHLRDREQRVEAVQHAQP